MVQNPRTRNNIIIHLGFNMDTDGISVQQTATGLKLILEGDLYKSIAAKWEEGQFRPFYTILKDFIKALDESCIE